MSKKSKEKEIEINMDGWSFAIVNNKLAEILFDRKKGKPFIWAHCYVKHSEYETKKEKQWILEDTKKYKFTWRNKKYKQVE